MKIKFIVIFTLLIASVFGYFAQNTSVETTSDDESSEVVSLGKPVQGFQSNKKESSDQKSDTYQAEDSITATRNELSFPIDSLDAQVNNQYVSDAKQKATDSEQALEQNLEQMLATTPVNYHSVFQWRAQKDEVLIAEYSAVLSDTHQLLTPDKALNIEELISEFVYQHDLNSQVAIEHLTCNRSGCIIYGVELQSGAWGQILSATQGQPWWSFVNNETRSGVGTDGHLTFFTVLR